MLIRRNISWQSILGGAPLVLLLLFFLYRVYGAAVYDPVGISDAGYDASLTAQQFLNQGAAILSGLFMAETSPVISAVFALLATALLVILAARVIGRRFDNRTLFMLFLLGQLVSMFVILSASFSVVLRYWYPLLPILAALLAFAAQFLLAFIHDRWRRLLPAAASAMIGFILFFVAVNYYNFLLQTTIQHGARHADAQVIGEIGQLLDAGEHIQVNQADFIFEPPFTLFIYFQDLAEAADGGRPQLQTAPPADPEQPYYFLDHLRRDYPAPAYKDIASREDYPILAYARRLSGALQPWNGADAPYQWYDSAAEYPWLYRWVIYDWPVNARRWMAYPMSETGAPVIRSDWNVNISGNRLTYIRESCSPADTETAFLLHIVPVDLARLPAQRRRYGFDNLDFSFEPDGVRADGACAVRARLPDYPIAVIRTGQYDADANIIWEAQAVSSAGNASGARSYLQRLLANAGEPIALSDWNIHRNGLQLTYIKQPCAPADTEATFLLHIVPIDLADLPAQRRRYGFDNLDFSFEPGGAMGDGACAAIAWLPDYPIAGIRTGQYIPGAAPPLWEVAISLSE